MAFNYMVLRKAFKLIDLEIESYSRETHTPYAIGFATHVLHIINDSFIH
jgi:hypothetical protein